MHSLVGYYIISLVDIYIGLQYSSIMSISREIKSLPNPPKTAPITSNQPINIHMHAIRVIVGTNVVWKFCNVPFALKHIIHRLLYSYRI